MNWPALMLPAFAESCGKSGRLGEGLYWLTKGMATAEKKGVTVADAELHRLKGELLIMKDQGNMAEAEQCLRTAIDIARCQEAKLFELRATVSLARLLASHGRREEAGGMVAEIYNWFTEGFDTADL